MATVNDEKFRALRGMGHTGAMNDMELQWLQVPAAVTAKSIPDAWLEWLADKGYTTGHRNDRWREFLIDGGFNTAGKQLNDMELLYWKSL